MESYLFGPLALLLVIGLIFDVWFGRELKHRKWVQAGLVALYALVLLAMPSCRSDDPDRPDGPDIPYSS